MTSIYDVDTNELLVKASEQLKDVEEIKAPLWAVFAKTGMHKERPPIKQDWWYIRSASVLRIIYKLGPIGVSKLRNKYGGKKNRGFKREHFYKGSGNIARKILQQLEKAGFVKQDKIGVHKGRVITGKGRSFLDKIATKIYIVSNPKKDIKVDKKVEDKQKEEKKIPVKNKAKIEIKKETKPEKKVDLKESDTKIKKEVITEPKVEEKQEIKKEEVKK